jgi:threonine dehydratase
VAIASGANMNFDRLRFVAERAEVGEQREAVLAVTLPEKPGSYKKVRVADRRAQHHRVQLPLQRPGEAHVFVGVQVADRAESLKLVAQLKRTATHARPDRRRNGQAAHPPSGRRPRAAGAKNELLYRFEFPERPGALMNFLNA